MKSSRSPTVLIVGDGIAATYTALGLANRKISSLIVCDGVGRADLPTYEVIPTGVTSNGCRNVPGWGNRESTSVERWRLLAGDQFVSQLDNPGLDIVRSGGQVPPLEALRDVEFVDAFRGRVSRLSKLEDGGYDVIVESEHGTSRDVKCHFVVWATPDETWHRASDTNSSVTQVRVRSRLYETASDFDAVLSFDPSARGTGAASRTLSILPVAPHLALVTETTVGDERPTADPAGSARQYCPQTVESLGLPVGSLSAVDYGPPRSPRFGELVIGPARSLVNPFTGQAAYLDCLSARSAVHSIGRARRTGRVVAAHKTHDALMRRALVGLEIGDVDTQRHHATIFDTLVQSLPDDGPFYTALRRALLVPRGLDALTMRSLDAAETFTPPPNIATHIWTVDALVRQCLARHWLPMMGALRDVKGGAGLLRPGVLLAVSHQMVGGTRCASLTRLGAAFDLATIAVFALMSSRIAVPIPRRSINLHAGGAVLLADQALVHAIRLAGAYGGAVRSALGEWIIEVSNQWVTGTDAASIFASALEAPMRFGAELASTSDRQVADCGEIGRLLGAAFVISENYLANVGLSNVLGVEKAGLDGLGIGIDVGPDALADRLAGIVSDLGAILESSPTSSGQDCLTHVVSQLFAPILTGSCE